MDQGLLWFDDRKNVTIIQKIKAAADFYEEKYGSKAECCYINPQNDLANFPRHNLEIKIKTSKYVLPNHYLLEKDQID